LDPFVWNQIIRLLENGTLLQAEIDRRKEAIRNTDPRQQRQETLRGEQARLGNNIERLITAYQEGLFSLSQLRERMPELNKRAKTVEAELQSLETGAMDKAKYLQLAENLSAFRKKLHARAKTLDVRERQQILRLLVKEILVDTQSLTIRHSIPISQTQKSPTPSGSSTTQTLPAAAPQPPSYLLRPWSHHCSLRGSYLTLRPLAVFRYPRLQPFLDQAQDPAIGHAVLNKLHRPFVAHVVKEASNVGVEHPVHALPLDAHRQRVQRLVRAASGTEPIRESSEVHLINLVEYGHHGLLYDFVFQRRDAQRTLPPVGLRYIDSS
jgi:site-specific DNA recombinase